MAVDGKRKLRVVVKIGTSSLLKTDASGQTSLALATLASTVEVLARLRNDGHDVVLVSSGAVGAGCERLNLKERPADEVARQALAAMGQVHLMCKYDMLFSSLGQLCAQVLLTYENCVDRVQFLNAKNTFVKLFEMGVIPIVNENDTVGIQELKADNDRLACMVSNMIGADLVFLMTDVDGVFTANPHKDRSAKRISYVTDLEELKTLCTLGEGDTTTWGTGGMAAKISAASLATSLGVRAVILHADKVNGILDYVEMESRAKPGSKEVFDLGTTFERSLHPPRERKRWVRSLTCRGILTVDDGAKSALDRHRNLFASGITKVEGNFSAFEAVSVVDRDGIQVAFGLVNMPSANVKKIMGLNSDEAFELVGQSGTVIGRHNMAYENADDATARVDSD
mmetsp:Transcript_14415/g.26732  ORF Transcript_14415/g.26732 Transcript_14415/m.26732 type:complete len:397 (-) Transcript_14415:421-1611(-)|eukprot:CAMPEP_0184523984 /NCGR_PEP_ID=MMETSP0198_2-20121128/9222_1 /TAXON_ID=1112570 /ORGANISM="Thraustochytrium sp., Strain LLF1b" /LENGTH=396 /DNA_ID=CAMNT_0026915145 /DNA_START=196 /DNA_END=1386 /DNA_ORIENTATION=+